MSVTLKSRGRSKKTGWRTTAKSKGDSLAVGICLQQGSAAASSLYKAVQQKRKDRY